mgnify:CR=1 FL=1
MRELFFKRLDWAPHVLLKCGVGFQVLRTAWLSSFRPDLIVGCVRSHEQMDVTFTCVGKGLNRTAWEAVEKSMLATRLYMLLYTYILYYVCIAVRRSRLRMYMHHNNRPRLYRQILDYQASVHSSGSPVFCWCGERLSERAIEWSSDRAMERSSDRATYRACEWSSYGKRADCTFSVRCPLHTLTIAFCKFVQN